MALLLTGCVSEDDDRRTGSPTEVLQPADPPAVVGDQLAAVPAGKLLPLRQGYIARRSPPPQALLGAVDRMMPMLRLLRHGDGALALFNGMGVTAPDLVAAALAYDDSRGQALATAPHVGYQRLAAGPALVIADCGLPAAEPSPVHPHAGTLAFEFSDGPQRLVISCGSPAPDRESLMRAARATAAHSTLVLDDRSSARFFEHRDRFGRLLAGVTGGPRAVEVNRQGGSDCETFALGFKEYKLGPVIGTRTWGGWVGIRGDKPFRDGGSMTEPEFGGWDMRGKDFIIEGHGVRSASSPSTPGSSTTSMPPPARLRTMAAVMPGSGLPMEPGLMSRPAKLAIMIPPVSVCHQLSWNGRPKASSPHSTPSGFSGSPTLAVKRSADRS